VRADRMARGRVGLSLQQAEPARWSRPSRSVVGTPPPGFSLATFPPGGRYQGQERPLAPDDVLHGRG
jgi:hypothetical protein